ncbi:MAG: hypothetical protein ACLRYB_18270 [Segatella copri]
MAGKLGRQGYDWGKLKTRIHNDRYQPEKLAKKHGIRYPTVCERSSKEGWVAARKKHIQKTCAKACAKISAKQANELAKELKAVNKLSAVIAKMLDDDEQFNRHIIQTRYKDGDREIWNAEEKVFEKMDTGAIKDAAQTLKLIEGMKRSMENILTMEQKNKIENDNRKLAIEEERLELETQRNNQGTAGDNEQYGVVMLAPILEEDDDDA